MKKKLQVFISSTYTDLIEERQAAVEAILDAGHIPAGMELFKAGNRSQLDTIYKWIDESDIFMLILGGRYGSIEPASKKSYTQLEYEYAVKKTIPVFSVVLSNRFLHRKASIKDEADIFEQKNIEKYNDFKNLVMSKMVREIDTIEKISIAIHTALSDFQNDPSLHLAGWIKSTEARSSDYTPDDYIEILTENRKLTKENRINGQMISEMKAEKIALHAKIKTLTQRITHLQKNNGEPDTDKGVIIPDFLRYSSRK